MKKILAFSGGPDSIYLLHQLLSKGEKPILAHLNHNLRGRESDEDELFCKQMAKKYGLVIETEKIDITKLAKSKKVGIEEAARIARYGFLERVRKKHNAGKILTAHHLNDSIETFILNLTRGAGLKGLTGIKSGKITRPLLGATKKEILSYLKKRNLPYRKDSSNDDMKYSRNRIRLKVIPELKKLNPNIEKTFAATMENLRSAQSFINSEIEKWTNSFDTKAFAKLHPYLQSAVLLKINPRLSKKNIEELKKIIARNKTGTRKLNMKIAYGKATFKKYSPREIKPTFSILTTHPKSLKSKSEIFLNFDKIGSIKKIHTDTFKPGDKIKPLGLNGKTKKLQDLFINKKIPRDIRKTIPVIKLGKEIICVGWLAIADKYKITKTTERILKISFLKRTKASKIKKLE